MNTKDITTSNYKNTLSILISKRPSNAFLLLTTGFLFSQFILLNILYTQNPLGGWVTSIGTFTTPFLLILTLLALSVCLITLWQSVVTKQRTVDSKAIKVNIVKTQTPFSPIDYPRGSTQAVVSAYSIS